MINVVGIRAEVDPASAPMACWLCIKPVSGRALFCHHCGTVQPVRELDHFTRLGIEPRFDVDVEKLDKQFTDFMRTLDPARFAIRGLGERQHASKQVEALTDAYNTLRDPMRRGRYWLALNGITADTVGECIMVRQLVDDLAQVSEPSAYDTIARRAGQELERGLITFMQALRTEDWVGACSQLKSIDGLEVLLANVHAKRTAMGPVVEA
jgi:molecular chaperone HscB